MFLSFFGAKIGQNCLSKPFKKITQGICTNLWLCIELWVLGNKKHRIATMFFVVHILFLILINWNLLFSYGGTAIVFKATNRNYTIIFITYNESSVIPKFPTCSAVFTGIRLPPYLSKLVNMVPWQKAINIGFTHFCATPARVTALSRWATVYYHSPIWSPRIVMSISSSQRNREKGRSKNDFA